MYRCLFFLLLFTATVKGQSDNSLPVLTITTETGSVPDEPKVMARIAVSTSSYGPALEGHVAIEKRGSSSKRFPKKGYGIEFRTSGGKDRQLRFLGLPREEDFVLHGPYSDKSLIRNALAYELAGRLEVLAPRYRLVELVLDDDYRGVYLLTESVKRDRQRVPVQKARKDASLKGGFIVKIDKSTGESSRHPTTFSSKYVDRETGNPAIKFLYDYPEPEVLLAAQREYIENEIHAFEASLSGEDWLDPDRGYRTKIDVGSFIDFMIINELTRNVDGYRLSTFLYQEPRARGGRLVMGPVWDFNLGFANADYCRADQAEGWAYAHNNVCGGNSWPLPFWWRRMMTDPSFRSELSARWQSLRKSDFSDSALTGTIDLLVQRMGSAPERNFERWDILNEEIWPNPKVYGNYAAEIEALKEWCLARSAWMDEALLYRKDLR